MASVFLSYDREDAPRARSVATALEKAGHTVWWDLHVRGGTQFAKAIEQALREADAVVVLWSKLSVESAWVRDEAAAGRDAGKLVPVTIDGTEPPLGFRQYQSISLRRWRGQSKASEFKQLLQAVGASGDDEERTTVGAAASSARKDRLPLRPIALLLIALALIAGLIAAWMHGSRPDIPTVTIVPADRSKLSEALARDLFVKLGHLDASASDPMEISAERAGKRADFSLEVSSASEGGQILAGAALLDASRSLLWSRDFQGSADKQGDLKQQVALATASVLQCANEAVRTGGLDPQTLKLYLNGCAGFAEANVAGVDVRSLSRLFRQVVQKAPKFDGAWSKLLLSQSVVIGSDLLPPNSPEARQLREDLAHLAGQHRDLPESYWAKLILLPNDAVEQAVSIAEQARTRHPDSAKAESYYALTLIRVGRMKEAVAALKRATELDPLSVATSGIYINTLAWAGQFDTARLELKKAETLWPGTSSVLDSRWRFALRYGDPRESLRISSANPDYRGFERYLAARLDPSPANVELAIAEAKVQVGHDPRAYGYLAQVFAEFGHEEELFELLGGLDRRQLGDGEVFFRPAFKQFRSDPRFMQVAKRLGLLDYWRKSGKWPDFCFEPDLPYDCKAEAAKLS